MSNDQVQEYINCFLDAAKIDDPMEARLPLYRAEELQKQMTPGEIASARQEAILTLLDRQDYVAAIGYFKSWLTDSPELATAPEIKAAAAKAYSNAAANQLEITEDIQKTFK